MIRTAPKMIAASTQAEDAADDLVDEARLLEQRLGLVEALDHEREGDAAATKTVTNPTM